MKRKTLGQIGNITSAYDRDTAGSQIGMRIWLYDIQDVDVDKLIYNENTREVADIPMKPGKFPVYHESIADSQEDKSTGEGGDLTSVVTNTFTYVVGGNRKGTLDFNENYVGGLFLIVYQICSTGEKLMLGTPCKPMRLKGFERVNGKESRTNSFTFENKSFIQPYTFTGTPTQEPAVVIGATATKLSLSTKTQYEIASGSASTQITAVAGVTDAMLGKVITVTGNGGAGPSVLKKTAAFILTDDWVANAGAKISLKIFNATTLVEQSRSE